jgi:kinesin family protein 12
MKHRKMGSHELNLESSRSHSIMTVYIDAVTTSPEEHDYGIPKFGKVSFVDLAGSERLKDTKSAGEMLKETANINKSLFTLGKVRLAKGHPCISPQTPSYKMVICQVASLMSADL